MTRRRTRTRPLPDHAPTAAEAERDLAVDRGEATDWGDELAAYVARRDLNRAADEQMRAGLAGWGES